MFANYFIAVLHTILLYFCLIFIYFAHISFFHSKKISNLSFPLIFQFFCSLFFLFFLFLLLSPFFRLALLHNFYQLFLSIIPIFFYIFFIAAFFYPKVRFVIILQYLAFLLSDCIIPNAIV